MHTAVALHQRGDFQGADKGLCQGNEREDSPWYPGVQLFRQQSLGEWAPVFAQAEAELIREYAQAV